MEKKKKNLFLVTVAISDAGYKLDREQPKEYPSQVWLNLVKWFQRRFL
jgi:hypothetical protein